MSKKHKKNKGQEPVIEKGTTIGGGHIKDDFCHYTTDNKPGTVGAGNHKVKGIGIVEEDMKIAFARLNVHLACLDDAFKAADIGEDIDTLHQHAITHKYTVTGFEMKGTAENPAIILNGTKFSETAGGHIDVKMPKINLDRGTLYKWYNELKEAAEAAIKEIELYHEGKYTLPENEVVSDPGQMTIMDAEFENGKLD